MVLIEHLHLYVASRTGSSAVFEVAMGIDVVVWNESSRDFHSVGAAGHTQGKTTTTGTALRGREQILVDRRQLHIDTCGRGTKYTTGFSDLASNVDHTGLRGGRISLGTKTDARYTDQYSAQFRLHIALSIN
ncbi:hypothetical protein GL58_18255 [Comamonas testosteroni]|uniref:Uncharacterized protein n=1 Tax=Comamonas testosteroni TaxID=285 RepID=A0A0L7N958_COMTE|nr:hypothetical protein GL58_18255 [Comamonas testosteroni]